MFKLCLTDAEEYSPWQPCQGAYQQESTETLHPYPQFEGRESTHWKWHENFWNFKGCIHWQTRLHLQNLAEQSNTWGSNIKHRAYGGHSHSGYHKSIKELGNFSREEYMLVGRNYSLFLFAEGKSSAKRQT